MAARAFFSTSGGIAVMPWAFRACSAAFVMTSFSSRPCATKLQLFIPTSEHFSSFAMSGLLVRDVLGIPDDPAPSSRKATFAGVARQARGNSTFWKGSPRGLHPDQRLVDERQQLPDVDRLGQVFARASPARVGSPDGLDARGRFSIMKRPTDIVNASIRLHPQDAPQGPRSPRDSR